MADWFLVSLATVLAVETFLRTPFKRVLSDLTHAARRANRTLLSRFISDHWKEFVLPRYALIIFRSSILLFGCLLLTALVVFLVDLIGARFGVSTIATMVTGWGIAYSTAVATLYALVRSRQSKNSDYSPAQKLLHYLALANTSVGEAAFDAEMRSADFKSLSSNDEQHVFISGLARAGTTILMRSIYDTGQFASLTYADMPFVLAPNLWSKIAGKNKAGRSLRERAHGDGILVNQDSPEALDEVFWRVFTKSDYVTEDSIHPHRATPEVIQNYRLYVSAIMSRYGKKRYVSKNNNNTLRLDSIRRAFPNAVILIPFRNPQQHAYSLLQQHTLFQGKQRQDPFVRRYMAWLGHYEFGLQHKPFNCGDSAPRHGDPNDIDYWLEQWNTVYRFLVDQTLESPDNIIFISYERLCEDTDRVWRKLCDKLELECSATPELRAKVVTPPQTTDSGLLKSANETYELLDRQCRTALAL